MTLAEAIGLYVNNKRANGIGFHKGESNFQGLYRRIGDRQLSEIRPQDVFRFLDGPNTSNVTFRGKHSLLRHFFEFMAARELMPEFSMPPNRPLVRQTFTPYIYSREELRRLLKATRYRSRWAFNVLVSPQTVRAFLVSLYATGALVGELIRLRGKDVDLNAGIMMIHSNRFGRTRKLPLSADLLKELQKYDRWKKRKGLSGEAFFLRDDETPLVARSLNGIFQRLRERARILRNDDAVYQPRMHDLRSTFAVHRITSWVKKKADLNKLLPALAVYMGQSGLASTERYFYLTPERFREDLEKLSPSRRHRRWRDDARLMQFLATL
jgi:integrase/recombinase XerD